MLLRKKGERAVTRSEGDMTPDSQKSFDYKNGSGDRSARELSGKLPVGRPCLIPPSQPLSLGPRDIVQSCVAMTCLISGHQLPPWAPRSPGGEVMRFFLTRTLLNIQKKKQILNERVLLFPYARPTPERCTDNILLFILLDFILAGLKKYMIRTHLREEVTSSLEVEKWDSAAGRPLPQLKIKGRKSYRPFP